LYILKNEANNVAASINVPDVDDVCTTHTASVVHCIPRNGLNILGYHQVPGADYVHAVEHIPCTILLAVLHEPVPSARNLPTARDI